MTQLKIGNIAIRRTAALAPMAGVADRAFRELCREYGACYTVTEMVSAKGLTMGSLKSAQLMELGETDHPAAIQLFGDDPEAMARAAESAMACGPDLIDINMGCPAPKIAGNGGGSALMKNPDLAWRIIRAVKNASPVPVTVKFRKGWDEAHINALEFALMAQDAGADAIAIHGRTRAQMYSGQADWEIIRRIKETVSIPVIGNGDVDTPQKALDLYRQTGCDLVMVGRGALGAPWLFAGIRQLLETGCCPPPPSLVERMEVMVRHVEKMIHYKGEPVALREARKHCGWYLSGIRGAASLRRMAGQITVLEDVRALAAEAVRLQEEEIASPPPVDLSSSNTV